MVKVGQRWRRRYKDGSEDYIIEITSITSEQVIYSKVVQVFAGNDRVGHKANFSNRMETSPNPIYTYLEGQDKEV
jgi:hypothetical protein